MKNAKGDGDQIQITCPEGGVVAGKLTHIGDVVVVPLTTASAGSPAEVFLKGTFEFEKDTDGNPYGGTSFAAKTLEIAMWDSASGLLVAGEGEGVLPVGLYTEDSGEDDDTAVVSIFGLPMGD